MVGEGSNPRPSSWDQGRRPENDFFPLELLSSDNSVQVTDENMLTEDFTSAFNFLHSGNNLQTSEGETSNHTTPHDLPPELWYTPEELQYIANITSDSYIDDPHYAFAPTLDFTHSGNDLRALGGESYTSMAPYTLIPELNFSPEEFQYNHKVPSAFNNGLPHNAFIASPDFPHNGSDLTMMDLSDFSYSGSDPHTCKSSTSNLYVPPGQLQSCGDVPPDFDNSLPPEAFVSPFDFFHCETNPQTSKSGSSTSMTHTLSSSSYISPEELRNSGSDRLGFNSGLRSNAFEFGPDFLQSKVSFRGFGNENSSTAFARQDQIFSSELSASHLNHPYSGHNVQIQNDEINSPDPLHRRQTLPQHAKDQNTDSLDSGNEWRTKSNMTFAPRPILQDHLLGYAVKCIFSGSNFQSFIRVVKSWPSASFLDISPKYVSSTSMSSFVALPMTLPHHAYPSLLQTV
ncbi:hypothetical protein MMC17_007202 [Xylographa soralifera]|nr:hypothetical protein [Xylographa soralifera]